MSAQHDPKVLLDMIDQQNKALEKLLAERDELRALLETNGQRLDALTCLQRTYNNPQANETNRIKAAAAAIGYELPKKGTTNLVVVDFRERVRQAPGSKPRLLNRRSLSISRPAILRLSPHLFHQL
jgi:hypothetical protein